MDRKFQEEKLNGRTSVTTTGEKKNLKATVDRDTIVADGADLTYVTVDVTDKDGNIIPNAEDKVSFKVEGEGKLVGIDNGRQDDHTSYQQIAEMHLQEKYWQLYSLQKKREVSQ